MKDFRVIFKMDTGCDLYKVIPAKDIAQAVQFAGGYVRAAMDGDCILRVIVEPITPTNAHATVMHNKPLFPFFDAAQYA